MGVSFKEYDVSLDRAAAQEMVDLTGQMGVPVTVIDGQAVIGFDRARLQTLLAAGAAGKSPVRFGLKIADASKVAPKEGAAPQPGAVIGAVSPGFLGEKAGLKEGDIITGISGIRIGGAADMERVLPGLKPGDIVTILFWRGNDQRKSEIVI
jgi:S1-C subfamily serine protease